MRVAILFDHFGPYHLARLRGTRTAGVDAIGLEVRSRSREYQWESPSDSDTVNVETILREEGASLEAAISETLDRLRPDAIAIPGWSGPSAYLAMRLSLSRQIPVVVMSESSAHDESRSVVREAVKRRYVALASAGLVGGTPHRAYLRELGMSDDRIFEGYDAVDNEHFARESARRRQQDGPQPPYFLASNRFIEKKNLFRLLTAYAAYVRSDEARGTKNQERDTVPWPLVLLGDGELKSALLAHAAVLGLAVAGRAPWEPPTRNEEPGTENGPGDRASASPTVYLPGFRQIDELPRFYAHAGAFVHASTTEQWGLVVNEAMASGLPAIVSNRCGCAPDLVKEGVNGWTFDPYNEQELASRMEQVASMPGAERRKLGERSRMTIADWGPERFAEGLISATKKALEVGPKRARWVDRMLLRMLIRK